MICAEKILLSVEGILNDFELGIYTKDEAQKAICRLIIVLLKRKHGADLSDG